MKLDKPVRIVMFIVLLSAVFHTLITVAISDFLKILPYVFWSYVFIATTMFADYAKEPRDEYPFSNLIAGLLLMAPIILVIIAIIFSIYISAKDLYIWATSPKFGTYQTAFMTGFMATLIAYSLFYFRLHRRMLYGITELLAGLMVVEHHAMSMLELQTLNPTILLAIFTAGIYLMVRGLDNIHLGTNQNETIASQLKKDIRMDNNKDEPAKGD